MNQLEQLLIWLLAFMTCSESISFSYRGCYVDSSSSRDLNGLLGVSNIGELSITFGGYVYNKTTMTHELCGSVCSLGGFRYFGIQVGEQCFCGNSFGVHGAAGESQCSNLCTGNSGQKCGAANRNSVFELSYPNKNVYTVLKQNSLTVISPHPGRLLPKSDADCLLWCSATADCQAAVFSQLQLECHLLAFAYPPASLTGPDWTLYQRG
uniref:WSC domain-containing protein n=1 Tax=Macrostomum lignano TaxID=282301 RepID=A0A1I8I8X8_9PLAT